MKINFKRGTLADNRLELLLDLLNQASVGLMTFSDKDEFYKKRVQNGNRAIIIVGNKKKLPIKELAKYGKFVELKFNDIVCYY